MSPPVASGLRYNIDRIVVRGRRIFGWGWVAHPEDAVARVSLLARGDGWVRTLAASHGLTREDVRQAFPELRNAAASGFLVTGYIPAEPARELTLEIEWSGGGRSRFDITGSVEAHASGQRKLDELLWLARAVMRRLRRGDLAGILRRARAQNYLAPTVDAIDIARHLLPRLAGAREVFLVFDHNMGGGANLYRSRLVEERVAGGSTVLLCTYNLPTLDYRLRLIQSDQPEAIYRIPSFAVLELVLDKAPVRELFLNSPVSFDEPLLFAQWLATMRAEHPRARLTVAAHEYLYVCPSFVLLDADGRYCGIPGLAQCAACLERHRASYVALSPQSEIGPWRAIWGQCLAAADEVRCFSGSTRTLLRRAFPALDPARLTVVPHRVDFRPARLPRLDHSAPLVVGIIGHISEQKGATVVAELLAEIERARADVRVVVIGTLDPAPGSRRLVITGPYERTDLADLIEAHGINACLFPSICPETFSYVIEEMMLLALPIVAFDLGAPGERLRGYANARLCGEVSAGAALRALVALHEDLARAGAPPAPGA